MSLPDLGDVTNGMKCEVCSQPGKHSCAACAGATYCGSDHQKEHWEEHKDECKAYRVLKSDKVGRYGVASRNLEAGEEVLCEPPVVVGPKVDSTPVCLGCYVAVDGSVLCSACGWPVCSQECEAALEHARFECDVFREAGIRFQAVDDPSIPCMQLECVTPLRAILARERDTDRWVEEVLPMESHNEARMETPGWEANQINIVNFLRLACKLENRFDEELIHTICGILEVNCFEIRLNNGYSIRGLYPQTAIMSHNCVANTTHSIVAGAGVAGNYRLSLRTTLLVAKGAELFTSYTHSLEPTLLRREVLSNSKFFECECLRCKDPTELATNLSSLKCNKCDNGLVISVDPLNPAAQWHCTHCEFATRGDAVRRVFSIIQNEIDTVEAMTGWDGEGVEKREMLVRKYRSVLHPRHAFYSALRHSLIQLYGRAEGYKLDDLPDIILERKVDLCKELLAVMDVLEPGLTRIRGMTLYEMHAPMMMLARNSRQFGVIDDKGFRAKMEEVASVLLEAVRILKLEPPSSIEGSIATVGEQSLEQLRTSIEALPK